MSLSITVDNTNKPVDTNGDAPKDENSEVVTLPKYLYGIAAGGAVLAVSVATISIHYIGKKIRQSRAEEFAEDMNKDDVKTDLDRLRGTIV